MSKFFALLFLLTLVVFIWGMLKPAQLSKLVKKDLTRLIIGKYIGGAALLLLVVVGIAFSVEGKSLNIKASNGSKKAVLSDKVVKPGISTQIITAIKPIPFNTIMEPDPTLAKGSTKVAVAGNNGEMTVQYEVTYDNGEEISRKVISEVINKEPINAVTRVGTKINSTPSRSNNRNYSATNTTPPSSGEKVKKGRSNLCHVPDSTFYDKTKVYEPYDSLEACLASGGRTPEPVN